MENDLVVKSNDLIEARYSLNLNEQKVILYAVSKLDRSSEKFNVLSLNIREFTEIIGTTSERYTEIREIVRELRKKEIIINTEKKELITGWLSSIEYIKDSGTVELEFSEKLIPYLLQLKARFTRYQLKNVLYLKNKYSIRIYELLKQYEVIKKRTFTVAELKKILVIEDKYQDFRNFDTWVIKTSLKEINEKTDLNIAYEKNKKGRAIDSLTFSIKSKENKRYIEYLDQTYNIKEFKEKSGLERENFDSKQIIELFTIATEVLVESEQEDLFEYIKLNYLHMIKNKAIKNKYAYLKKALKEDHAVARGQIKLDYRLDNSL